MEKVVRKRSRKVVKNHFNELNKKSVIFIDVGRRDEYNIQYGSRILHSLLTKGGVPHIYEEFEGGHHDTSFRYEYSIAILEKYLNNAEN